VQRLPAAAAAATVAAAAAFYIYVLYPVKNQRHTYLLDRGPPPLASRYPRCTRPTLAVAL